MAALLSRVYTAFSPPTVEKKSDAIKIGILGAARTAPLSLITPAKSHPEVIVQVIAARDHSRAEAFAKKHGIPEFKTSYQEVLDDPNIDAVFIPLPNSLHFEWSLRAIRAGKHVLLEKPATANAIEASILFSQPELSKPGGPVLLEAFHNRFHPSIRAFRSLINPAEVEHVHTDCMVPWVLADKNGIEFNYDLAGGSIAHIGTYTFTLLRLIFDAEPEECLSCETRTFGDGIHDRCDKSSKVSFRFPNGGIGEGTSTLWGPLLWKPSEARVTHRQVVVPDNTLPSDQEKLLTRQVTLHGFMQAFIWHRIDVKDSYVIRNKVDGQPVKTWVESKSQKVYSYKDAGAEFANVPGEDWWMSYRYQLEEFVNRVKGRRTQTWIGAEDSINLMKMVDMAYEKSGLGLRPTSSFG
ncbi:hypothetical protein A1O3_02164 [Capronia epimyces CBS 606.96]|uniref:D-xylose 1-dehydrogenase (NADP(+), D-xylono-1,5-lactone-forming) n=1 Tax=Capronia epimyces CBS 606.96 TaxID=1182542 RepID=W9YHG0_9EURO|nr:uncharacterized protein A1O3_02164 [Capronia epimyces CBS 606.96]EXJ89100.1 hypothetical protein A1O3_02164 [Capronia epimyces CBS 606.96]